VQSPITVAANGLEFSGLRWGPPEQSPVLLLHGFPQRCTSWAAVAQRLEAMDVHVVALDQRGYSPGARPRDVSAYALPNLVADAAGMLTGLGAPAHLVGHDWGGVVGWQVAARHPALVRSWTAVSTPNPTALGESIAADPAQRAQFGYMRMLRAPTAEQDLLADGAARLRAFYGGALSPAREDEDVSFLSQPDVLTGALNWYRAMARDDAAPVPRITVPTSFVWGSEDLAFGRAAAEHSAEFVDASYDFLALEGASHWLPDEAPDAVADVIAARVLG
jgi:pimeloyl-ACP methyl ester carboxylesterase